MSIRSAYGALRASWRHPVPDRGIVSLAVVVGLSVRTGESIATWAAVSVAAGLVLPVRGSADGTSGGAGTDGPGAGVLVRSVVIVVGCAILGGWRSEAAWSGLQPDVLGPFDGWVLVVDDPQPYSSATRVIVEADGERFESWHRGRASRLRAGSWRAGEWVRVSGDRVLLDDERAGRVAWQHVVGQFELEWASDVVPGRPVDRASNRVRAAIERGAATLPGDDGSLFRGLVVGDDRDQPRAMIDRFRASGLSHLTAVSGQNVSFVLAAAGPLLVRLRPWWRWAVTLGLIGWFVSLTRFEPSIVRAGVMAGLSATGFVLGRERTPLRLTAWAVIGLLLIDPLIAWSVGFWLSVGATTGVVTVGPWLGGRLQTLGPLAVPVGVTVGAQVGVVVPLVWVFGSLPVVSVPANLLAVPVAGFVMLYGLPAGLVAGAVADAAPWLATVVMLPCRFGVRWVDTVAVVAARLEPGGSASWWGWAVFVVAIGLIVAGNRGRHGAATRRPRASGGDPEGARHSSPSKGSSSPLKPKIHARRTGRRPR